MIELPPDISQEIAQLRRRFLASLPEKADHLETLAAACESRQWDHQSRAELHTLVHQLAGSLGMHGLQSQQALAESLDTALEESLETSLDAARDADPDQDHDPENKGPKGRFLQVDLQALIAGLRVTADG